MGSNCMSKEDLIQLMDLLTEYNETYCEPDIKQYADIKDKSEFAVMLMVSEHKRVIEQIKEIICLNF